jgi:hypothetical protein
MNYQQREAFSQRYWRPQVRIRAIHLGKVVDSDPAAIEVMLLQQQEEIEFLLGCRLL